MIRHVTLACVACACLCQTSFTARASEPVAASEPGTTVAQASAELKSRREELIRLQAEVARLEELTGEFEKVRIGCRFIDTDMAGLSDLGIDPDGLQGPERVARLIDRRAFDVAFGALRDKGAVEQWTSPALIAANGRPASIRVGGEFPILVPQQEGTATIQWMNYGDRVDATCKILGDGKLHLECTVENSNRDFSHSVELQGTVIPGMAVRMVSFESEMEFGRVLVVMMGTTRRSDGGVGSANTDDDAAPSVNLCVITADPVTADDR